MHTRPLLVDDTRINSTIISVPDSQNLRDLDLIITWACNNMRLNSENYQLIHYGTNAELKSPQSWHPVNNEEKKQSKRPRIPTQQ